MGNAIDIFSDVIKNYWNVFLEKTPFIILAIFTFIFFLLISSVARIILVQVVNKIKDRTRTELFVAIERVIRITIVVIGIVVSFGVAGVKFSSLLTSLGLIGFALGFVLRDYIQDFLGGIVILTQKPFVINDEITIGDHTGRVRFIEVRFTAIRTLKNEDVLIPNSQMLSSQIVKKTTHQKVRMEDKISFNEIKDDKKLEEIKKGIISKIKKIDGIEKGEVVELTFSGINEEIIKYKLNYYTKASIDNREDVKIKVLQKLYEFLKEKKLEKIKIS